MFIRRTLSCFATAMVAMVMLSVSLPAQEKCNDPKNPNCSTVQHVQQAGKSAVKKVEGWANVPGGTVWLEPGRQAYEHDTGLVRDLATGQKSYPITPQSLARMPVQPQSQPMYQPVLQPQPVYRQPVYVQPQPLVYSPYVQPVSPIPMSPMTPTPNPYYNPRYDTGPYGPGGCYDCGAISTSRSGGNSIGNRWPTIGALPK